jgi:hypothetical protein
MIGLGAAAPSSSVLASSSSATAAAIDEEDPEEPVSSDTEEEPVDPDLAARCDKMRATGSDSDQCDTDYDDLIRINMPTARAIAECMGLGHVEGGHHDVVNTVLLVMAGSIEDVTPAMRATNREAFDDLQRLSLTTLIAVAEFMGIRDVKQDKPAVVIQITQRLHGIQEGPGSGPGSGSGSDPEGLFAATAAASAEIQDNEPVQPEVPSSEATSASGGEDLKVAFHLDLPEGAKAVLKATVVPHDIVWVVLAELVEEHLRAGISHKNTWVKLQGKLVKKMSRFEDFTYMVLAGNEMKFDVLGKLMGGGKRARNAGGDLSDKASQIGKLRQATMMKAGSLIGCGFVALQTTAREITERQDHAGFVRQRLTHLTNAEAKTLSDLIKRNSRTDSRIRAISKSI